MSKLTVFNTVFEVVCHKGKVFEISITMPCRKVYKIVHNEKDLYPAFADLCSQVGLRFPMDDQKLIVDHLNDWVVLDSKDRICNEY